MSTELTVEDYDRMLRLVADCALAADVRALGERLAEGLAADFGYRHVTVCPGPSMADALREGTPITSGAATRLVSRYHEEFAEGNFLTPHSLARGSVLSGDLDRRRLTPAQREYLEDFLLPHGVEAQLGCFVGDRHGPGLVVVLSGDRADAFGDHDRTLWRVLRRPLAAVAMRHLGPAATPPPATSDPEGPRLTPREEQVAALARLGHSNRSIARRLGITEDTVKRHMTRVLTKTGARSRAELAARHRLRVARTT